MKSTDNVTIYNSPENVGREGFMYLSYIFREYNAVWPVKNIFCQIIPDHFQYNIHLLAADIDRICRTDFKFSTADFYALGVLEFPWSYEAPVTYRVDEIFQAIALDYPTNLDSYRFSPGGCFVVSEKAIKQYPRETYFTLARFLGDHVHPEMGFAFERTWAAVFNRKPGQIIPRL